MACNGREYTESRGRQEGCERGEKRARAKHDSMEVTACSEDSMRSIHLGRSSYGSGKEGAATSCALADIQRPCSCKQPAECENCDVTRRAECEAVFEGRIDGTAGEALE